VTCICGRVFLYPQGFPGFPHFALDFGKCRCRSLV
jgi:hypothetical protein